MTQYHRNEPNAILSWPSNHGFQHVYGIYECSSKPLKLNFVCVSQTKNKGDYSLQQNAIDGHEFKLQNKAWYEPTFCSLGIHWLLWPVLPRYYACQVTDNQSASGLVNWVSCDIGLAVLALGVAKIQ